MNGKNLSVIMKIWLKSKSKLIFVVVEILIFRYVCKHLHRSSVPENKKDTVNKKRNNGSYIRW